MTLPERRRFDAAILAVCPIVGTSGDPRDPHFRIDFADVTRDRQRAAARAVVDSFDWSDVVQLAWESAQGRKG